jgi:hypothetical protein
MQSDGSCAEASFQKDDHKSIGQFDENDLLVVIDLP